MGIRVINATYATNSKGNNVTEICQAIVDTGNDDIGVNNEAMGAIRTSALPNSSALHTPCQTARRSPAAGPKATPSI